MRLCSVFNTTHYSPNKIHNIYIKVTKDVYLNVDDGTDDLSDHTALDSGGGRVAAC
jgi:hypothetical protein